MEDLQELSVQYHYYTAEQIQHEWTAATKSQPATLGKDRGADRVQQLLIVHVQKTQTPRYGDWE